MTYDDDEAELGKGLQSGDLEAWNALFVQAWPSVWKFVAARMLGCAASGVEDVVQETMLLAARAAQQYDPDTGPILAWLKGIARNQIAQHFRKEKRQNVPEMAGDELLASSGRLNHWLNGTDATPKDWLVSQEAAQQVRLTLESLPDEHSRLLSAKYIEGLKIAEIAEQEQSSPTAIHSKLARARKAFREKFESTQVK